MVLVSTITIKGTPGSTISVTEIREDGGRIRLVVRGAHVTLENIVVQHGEEIEQADGEVGTQNAGVVQNASAGDNQAAETQQEETKEGEEEVNTSLPSSSFSSSSSSPLSSSSTTLSLKQDYNEPFYRVLALMLDDLYERGGTFGSKWTRRGRECGREGGLDGDRGQANKALRRFPLLHFSLLISSYSSLLPRGLTISSASLPPSFFQA